MYYVLFSIFITCTCILLYNEQRIGIIIFVFSLKYKYLTGLQKMDVVYYKRAGSVYASRDLTLAKHIFHELGLINLMVILGYSR